MRNFRFLLGALLLLAVVVAPATAQPNEVFNPAEPTSSTPPDPNVAVWTPSEAILFDNGPLETQPGESVLQSTTLGMNILGFGHQVLNDNRIADDFTIGDTNGWTIDQITFFAYQSFSPTTSTMTQVNARIYDAAPPGGNVVWDGFGGCMASTAFSNIFRVTETTIGATDRPIMAQVCTVGMDFPAGTYWIEWQTDGSLGSGPWAPPITIIGQSTTGNGLQSVDAGVSFQSADDSGSLTQQGFPFVVEGEVIATFVPVQDIPTLGQWGMIAMTLLLIALGIFTLSRRKATA